MHHSVLPAKAQRRWANAPIKGKLSRMYVCSDKGRHNDKKGTCQILFKNKQKKYFLQHQSTYILFKMFKLGRS